MMRLLALGLVLFLLTACQRYTIGAANAAPRVVSGVTDVRSDHLGEGTEEMTTQPLALPELESARVAVTEAFAVRRGSQAAREEAATKLESAREALKPLSESGTIAHWDELDESFAVAIEKIREGTNDAPNALNRLIVQLEEVGQQD
jgi:hypothetical protein